MIEGSSPRSLAAAASPIVCPYLGLADDPRTHFAFATIANRCQSGSRPRQIEVNHQVTVCLSAIYPACPRYVVPTIAAAGLAVVPGRAEAPIARVSGRLRWRSGPPGRRRLVVRAAILLGALTLAIVAAALIGQGRFLSAGPSGVSGSSAAASVAGGEASPAVSPQAGPTASGPPTASPPGKAPSLPTTHVVARGETLKSIARHYKVTLTAIQKANGIKNPNLIRVGQRLIIPAP